MTTILIKKKDTAGAPAAGDLTNAAGGAEIAVNTATKRLYTKDSGGNVVELGTNPSALTTNLLFSPDATYDIGASGASRPRDQYLSRDLAVGRNLTVGGTFTVTGGINFNGNVTVGDSSADTLTINSTITSNLIFTDNTYDIGASGATRPRTGYFGTSMFIGNNVAAGTQFEVYGSTSTYSTSQVLFYDTTSNATGPSNGLMLKREGGSTGYYSSALTFDVGGGGGRAKIYTSRLNALGGKLYFATDDTSGTDYQRYYIDESGIHRWINVDNSTGTLAMSLDSNGLYSLNSLGVGVNPSSTYKIAATVSNQVGIFVTGNTSGQSKQDLYITRASAGSTIQTGPNITLSNNANNGSWAIQVMNDGALSLWNYLSGAWEQNFQFGQRSLNLNGGSSASSDIPLYISGCNSAGVGLSIDGGGVNSRNSVIQFQQQNVAYWRIGMPQNANRMAIYAYASATYPETFSFLEGSAAKGTLGIGTGASTNGDYSIDITANSNLAINMSRSGGTGIRLNDLVTNSWDIYNVSNQLQFVRGGTLGWYMDGGRAFIRKATADGTFFQILSSYPGNPEIVGMGQTGSDGYIAVKSAGGDTTYLTGYSVGTSYFTSYVAIGTTSTAGNALRVQGRAGSNVVNLATGNTANTSVTTFTCSGGSGDGVKFADVDIGGQGLGGSYLEWTRGGSYDNYLNFWIRNSGNTSAKRFEFLYDGTANKSSGAGSWGALSDARLKKNFAPVTGGLARIMQLQPKEYDFIVPSAHNDRTHERGFVAQDFEVVYPSSVTTSELTHKDEKHLIPEGETAKALSFKSEFYADLVDAIQTLKNEFDAYKASHP